MGEHGGIGALGQIEEEEIRFKHQILIQAADTALRIGRMQQPLRIAQQETYN